MNKLVRLFYLIAGVIIISLSLNYFIIPNTLVSFGTDGVSLLLSYLFHSNVYVNMLILNVILLLIASILVEKNTLKSYILPSILIPVFGYSISFFTKAYPIELPEMILNVVVSSFMLGIGYGLIYKQGFKAGSIFLIEDMLSHLTKVHLKIYSLAIDIVLVIITSVLINLNIGLYSAIMIIVVKYLIEKADVGYYEDKMFYIITKKEDEVKDYIMNELHYKLTTLDVKGGYSKKDNHILLSIISAGDYYKLKSGIKLIDKSAFIAIVDTYDCINRKEI